VLFNIDTSGMATVSAVPTVETQTTGTAFDRSFENGTFENATIPEGSCEGTLAGSSAETGVSGAERLSARGVGRGGLSDGKRVSGGSLCAAAARADIVQESRMSDLELGAPGAQGGIDTNQGGSSGLTPSMTQTASGPVTQMRSRSKSSRLRSRSKSSTRRRPSAGTGLSSDTATAAADAAADAGSAGAIGASSDAALSGGWRQPVLGAVLVGRRTPQAMYEYALSEATNTPRGAHLPAAPYVSPSPSYRLPSPVCCVAKRNVLCCPVLPHNGCCGPLPLL
jgi:hypothetical protein